MDGCMKGWGVKEQWIDRTEGRKLKKMDGLSEKRMQKENSSCPCSLAL